MEEDLVKTVDDFQVGSLWIQSDTFGDWPVLVVDLWKPRPEPKGSIDHVIYLDLTSGKTWYSLQGSRSMEMMKRMF
jgi:hypothetical protein